MIKTMSKLRYPLYIMFHPINGFDELKYRKKTSLRLSILIFTALAVLNIFSQQFQGLQFVMGDKDKVDFVMAFGSSFAIWSIFVLSNWAFCVVMDGKAKLIEIWIITMYSLVPYIILKYIIVILSNFVTRDEGVFLSFLSTLGILWSFLMIVFAFMNFHEYEFSKAIMSLILTWLGMLIVIFLIFLAYSLFQQISDTLKTVLNEILFRIRLRN